MKTVLRVREFEERLVPAVAIDSAYETYAWVFINTLRANPSAFADNLNGLKTGTVNNAFGFSKTDAIITDLKSMINRASVPAHYADALALMHSTANAGPYAWDDLLETRANSHNDWMRTNGFEHTEVNSGNRSAFPGYSKNNAAPADTWGYSGQYSWYGEDIGYAVGSLRATKAAYNAGTITLDGFRQRAAFLDSVAYMLELNSGSLGHLENLLGRDHGTSASLPSFNSIGFDTDLYQAPSAYETQDSVPEAYISTQRLALYRPGDTGGYVAGIVFTDQNSNGFYDIGEGAALTVDVRNSAHAGFTDILTASNFGAYSGYVANGTYTVTISSDGVTLDSKTVTVNDSNAAADFALSGLSKPTLSTPIGAQSALRPQVSWNAVDDATGYQVRVDNLTTKATNIFNFASATGTNWSPTADLISGDSYRVWVRAVRGTTLGPWSDPKDFSIAKPTLVGPSGTVADLRPTLSWTAIAGATYRIYIDDLTTKRNNIFPGLTSATSTGSPPSDLVSGHHYRWRVLALNSLNQGVLSVAGAFIVGKPVLSGLSTGIANLRPTFSWTAVAGAAGYEVRVNDISTKKNNVFPGVIITGTNWTPPSDLVSGRSYVLAVRALNSANAASFSVGNFSVGKPILSAVSTGIANLRPSFSWTAVAGAAGYEVRVNDSSAKKNNIFPGIVITGTTWTPPADLVSGRSYVLAVRALNSASTASFSVGRFSIGKPILGGLATGIANLRPSFSWTAVAGAAGYEVRVNDISTKKNNIFPAFIITSTNWTPPSDLVSGRSYVLAVRALNTANVAAWATGKFSVGRPISSGPTGTLSDRTPTYTWTTITGAASYRVRLDDLTTGTMKTYKVATTTWTPPADLRAGHKYRFAVAAVNSFNLGVVSVGRLFTIV